MRKHNVVPTKTQIKWKSVNEQVRLALNKVSVADTSVTLRKQSKSQYEMDKKQKMIESHNRYMKRHNLKLMCVHIPTELHSSMKRHCKSKGEFISHCVTMAILDYITKK